MFIARVLASLAMFDTGMPKFKLNLDSIESQRIKPTYSSYDTAWSSAPAFVTWVAKPSLVTSAGWHNG
ncbi:hypothetical protein OCU04_006826 [Sclerotinia nivalis]|uniref:Uncharacterized protein n=1 Tax=Sclerotinia nivalis TaxID=352851 RepID=A0A9X0ALH1_9HELO|nr:hypothetical protein OCU04_006826 [Sclerotinia nivalis]